MLPPSLTWLRKSLGNNKVYFCAQTNSQTLVVTKGKKNRFPKINFFVRNNSSMMVWTVDMTPVLKYRNKRHIR